MFVNRGCPLKLFSNKWFRRGINYHRSANMTYNVGYSLEAAVYAEHLKLALFRAGVLHLLKPSTGNKANQNESKPCTQGKIRRYGALAAPLCT